jgi:Mrp family chromosome partitioning ATPase
MGRAGSWRRPSAADAKIESNTTSCSLGPDASEPVHQLVQNLFFCSAEPPQVVVVSGVETGDAASRLCEPLAAELALQAADDVCLVDGESKTDVDECGEQVRVNLWRIRARVDPCHPWVEHWQNRIHWLRREFRYAVIHSPPVLMASDAMALGRLTDGLVLVLEAHRTRRLAALRAKASLEAGGVRLLGTVLSERTFPIPEALYQRL